MTGITAGDRNYDVHRPVAAFVAAPPCSARRHHREGGGEFRLPSVMVFALYGIDRRINR